MANRLGSGLDLAYRADVDSCFATDTLSIRTIRHYARRHREKNARFYCSCDIIVQPLVSKIVAVAIRIIFLSGRTHISRKLIANPSEEPYESHRKLIVNTVVQ